MGAACLLDGKVVGTNPLLSSAAFGFVPRSTFLYSWLVLNPALVAFLYMMALLYSVDTCYHVRIYGMGSDLFLLYVYYVVVSLRLQVCRVALCFLLLVVLFFV